MYTMRAVKPLHPIGNEPHGKYCTWATKDPNAKWEAAEITAVGAVTLVIEAKHDGILPKCVTYGGVEAVLCHVVHTRRTTHDSYVRKNPGKECSPTFAEEARVFERYAKLRKDHGTHHVPAGWDVEHARGLALKQLTGRTPVKRSPAAKTRGQPSNAPGTQPSVSTCIEHLLSAQAAEVAWKHGVSVSTVSNAIPGVLAAKLPKLEAFIATFITEAVTSLHEVVERQTSVGVGLAPQPTNQQAIQCAPQHAHQPADEGVPSAMGGSQQLLPAELPASGPEKKMEGKEVDKEDKDEGEDEVGEGEDAFGEGEAGDEDPFAAINLAVQSTQAHGMIQQVSSPEI
ncbi:hypothetical protein V8C86DRAFT_2769458 [Haematococcus lacustris]